jgi:uncharacterized protein (DUF58 family)
VADGATTLTRRGWSLLGAAVGLLISGRLLGTAELMTLGLSAGALITGALLWTRTRTLPLALVRTPRPARVPVGSDARVDLELRSNGPTPQVTVTDRFDDGRRAARFITPALERGQPARAAYRIPTDRRGRFTIGPAIIGIADPFGLTHRFVELGGTDDVIVRPRVHALSATTAAPGQRRSSAQRRALVPVPSPAHDEFLALRDYEVGDDLRRIHWRSTARLGELIVREDESEWQPETVIVLDNRAGAHRHGTYEATIEALASIAVRVGRAGRTVDILTTAGRRLGSVGGEGLRVETLLDELAVLAPDADAPLAAAIRRLRAPARRGMLVVVTGAPDDLTPFTGLAGSGAPVSLVVCGGAPPRVGGAVRIVDGRPGEFVGAWNRAMASGRRTGRWHGLSEEVAR